MVSNGRVRTWIREPCGLEFPRKNHNKKLEASGHTDGKMSDVQLRQATRERMVHGGRLIWEPHFRMAGEDSSRVQDTTPPLNYETAECYQDGDRQEH